MSRTGQIIVEFSTQDPQLANVLTMLNEMPEHTPQRQECEALLYTFLARSAWRRADQLHGLQRKQAARQARAAARGAAG